MKPSEIAFGLVRIPADFLMTMLAFVIAYRIRFLTDLIPGIQLPIDQSSFPTFYNYLEFSAIASAGLILLAAANKNYSLKAGIQSGRELKQIFITTTIWLAGLIAWFFLTRTFPFSRLALIYTWILTIMFITVGRMIARAMQFLTLKAGIGRRQILFIGHNAITGQLCRFLQKNHTCNIAGYIETSTQAFAHKENKLDRFGIAPKNKKISSLGDLKNLKTIIKKHHIEEIIQTTADIGQEKAAELLNFCREHHLDFSFVPNLLEVQQTNIETETISGIPVIRLKPTPLDGWGKVIKRSFDLLISFIGLVVLSPIMGIVAIAVKSCSKGTIFYKYLDDGSRVKRVGERGKLFNFHKFRTMYANTHNLRYTQLAKKNIRNGSPLVKIKDDPRVTRVGRFLRKTSLDELPQLFNVLKGEMSLVGPRPHLPEEVAKYQKHHKFVLTIKPGITGLAQISGRSDLNFEEEVRLDTYYIEHWSLWLDIKVMLKTLLVLLKGYRE